MLLMDSVVCNVVYVDRDVREDRVVTAEEVSVDGASSSTSSRVWETPCLGENVNILLGMFSHVYLCATGKACISRLLAIEDGPLAELRPTIVLIDVPHDERIPHDASRPTSPRSGSPRTDEERTIQIYPDEDEVYGLQLLQKLVSEAHLRNVSKLVVPIPVISFLSAAEVVLEASKNPHYLPPRRAAPRGLVKSCLDLGATDVMVSPLHVKCVTALEIHAYRAHKEAAKDQKAMLEFRRGRKRSWVGVSDDRPFAYLREAMVSSLMKKICQMRDENDDKVIESLRINLSADRRSTIAAAIGRWHFSAHDYTDDELVVVASLIFRHALAMPELERWRIPTGELTTFVIACRAAYNSFVPYHNFRHVVDVLQATFHFLLRIEALPPYPSMSPTNAEAPQPKAPISSLVEPFEALTLLITAIGHDVGHPGVNNGFLVVLNSPLAQLYNDRSVLESFHCAAYSQILRRYWPSAFRDTKMRNLMISSILATDMGLHFDYMKKMGDTQEKLSASNSTDGWNGRMLEDQKALACALLIKCADISNVARNHGTALQWMRVLCDEFARQASMEHELEITSSLMAQPRSDMLSLSKAQLGFMNLFAIPLFQGVADIMPSLQYTVEELESNKALFENTVAEEQTKLDSTPRLLRDGTFSPRTMSYAGTPTPKKETAAPTFGGVDQAISPASSEKHVVVAPSADAVAARFMPDSTSVRPLSSSSKHQPAASRDGATDVNGISTQFDAVADFAASDPFNFHERHFIAGKHRSSEATEGSTSAPGTGDWASQATSATTGKLPLSPSTQGTSIISKDSLERPTSVPVTTITAPDTVGSKSESQGSSLGQQISSEDGASSVSSSNAKCTDSGLLKKKSSRFRMNALNLFRRHKTASPPLPTADTAG